MGPGASNADSVDDALNQIRRIEQVQRAKAAYAIAMTVVIGQLLGSAFIWGHARGPMPPSVVEVLGIMLTLLIGSLLVAPWAVARKKREGTSWVGRLREGSHSRKLLIFDDAFILDGEVIPYDLIESFELGDGDRSLHLRYLDVRHGGPVIRDLEGLPEALRRIARRAEGTGGPGSE